MSSTFIEKGKLHTIYIKFVIRSDTQLYPALQLLQKQFIIEKKEDFSFGNMWRGEEYYIAHKEYQALDITKAVSMAAKEFGETKELFDMWQGVQGCIRDDQQYGWVENNRLNLIMVKKRIMLRCLDMWIRTTRAK